MTQAVCEVCAVSFDDVRAVAERLPTKPEVISLDPSTLGEVLADMPRLAEAAGVPEAGEQLTAEAGERLEAVERAVEGAPRPRVAALEWLDPIFIGGHWVPQMIELAGGEDVLGLPGEKSRTAEWGEVEAVGARGRRLDAVRLLRRAGRGGDDALAQAPGPARRARVRGGRRRLLLAARAAPGGRRGAARPPAAPRAGARAADAALDRAGPGARRRRWASRCTTAIEPTTAAAPSPAQSRFAAAGGTRTMSGSSNSTSAASVPPISPPMWPPIEMPETVKVISRLSPIQRPRPLSIGLMPRLRMTITAAPIRPKMPPEAPTVSEFGSTTSAPNEPASSETKKISAEAHAGRSPARAARRGSTARTC